MTNHMKNTGKKAQAIKNILKINSKENVCKDKDATQRNLTHVPSPKAVYLWGTSGVTSSTLKR